MTHQRAQRFSKRALSVCSAIAMAVVIVRLSSTLDSAPRHGDESYWLQSSYFYYLALHGDFANPAWSNVVAYDHPPVAKYIFGLALHIGHDKTIQSAGGLMSFHRFLINHAYISQLIRLHNAGDIATLEFERQMVYWKRLSTQLDNTVASPLTVEDFRIARITSWSFALLSALVVVGICTHLTKSAFAGFIGGLIFLQNGVTVPCFQQALAESMCWFFVLAGLFVHLLLFRELTGRSILTLKVVILAILEGVLVGLAMGTKFVAASMPLFVTATYLWAIGLQISRGQKGLGHRLPPRIRVSVFSYAIVSASALSVFILSNPFLIQDPVRNISRMVDYRTHIMEVQLLTQPAAIETLAEKFNAIWSHGVLLNLDPLVWPVPTLIWVVLGSAGAISLWRNAIEDERSSHVGGSTIVGMWIIITFVVTAIGFHMLQERYLIPFAICMAFLVAVGADTAVNRLMWPGGSHGDRHLH